MESKNLRDHDLEVYRKKLVGLAYRMVGSVEGAEDIAQDALLKWLAVDQESIKTPIAWLNKVTIRLAIDYLKSAKNSREEYIGPWLPEPFIYNDQSPDAMHEIDESISMALMIVMERLTPAERAAYILHDIFSYRHKEIADIMHLTSIHTRQLVSRSRKKLKSEKIRINSDIREHNELIHAFFGAVKKGDVEGLKSLLSNQINFHADGGGKAIAARKIIQGVEEVARFVLKVLTSQMNSHNSGVNIVSRWFNGSPGVVIMEYNKPVTAFHFHIVNNKIQTIYAIRNPDKLTRFK